MRVYTSVSDLPLKAIGPTAERAERLGFDEVTSGETTTDPMIRLTLAAGRTERVTLTTGVLIAFARSPMVVAYQAWALQELSDGRFVLGLGSQVKGHIERRFSMPWSAPGPRLREYVLAVREIWRAFQEERAPNFHGEHYRFSLMNPEFRPRPIAHPNIPIIISGVNPYMCRMAGEVCDGLRTHSFNTRKYLTDVILPQVETGLQKSGRRRADFTVWGAANLATGRTDADVARAVERARRTISFYAATRTYHPVLAVHGWEDIGQELHRLSRAGQWDEMARLVPDEMVETFAVVGRYDQIGARLRERFAGVVDVVRFELPEDPALDGALREVLRELQAA